jgi:transmembrane sensor
MKQRISDRIAEEAGYWDARLRSPECTEADRVRFAAWRDANPRHREAFERLQAILTTLHRSKARADVRALRDAAVTAEKPRASHGRLFAAVTGSIACALACWMILPDHLRRVPVGELLTMAESLVESQAAEIYETGTGQRSTCTLRDGSSVELDAKTRLKVAFNKNTRAVELVYGQALFHVAHNTQRPFIVRAADREITAVGTEFDVRLDATSVRVTLIEGKVKVSHDTAAAGTAFLTPGQQLVARLSETPGMSGGGPGATRESALPHAGSADTEALIHLVDIEKVTGWRDGRIFLEDSTLPEAVAEMNRHSPLQIIVRDPQLATLRVNGMFRAGEQQAFVSALEQYFPIDAEHRGDTEIVLTAR